MKSFFVIVVILMIAMVIVVVVVVVVVVQVAGVQHAISLWLLIVKVIKCGFQRSVLLIVGITVGRVRTSRFARSTR